MGKYTNSEIHNYYSDWHWQLIKKDNKYKNLYVSDIDRLWIEYDFTKKAIVGIIDIKWEASGDTITPTEKGIYEWFYNNGVKVYTVFINREFTQFKVINYLGKQKIFNEIEYANFLLGLRNKEYDKTIIK